MPRRRTFFGQTSDQKLRVLIAERSLSDSKIRNIEIDARRYERGPEISLELIEQNGRDREMRMAAKAELGRRQKRASIKERY